MVAGFIAFWPVGLALLGYMIWSKRMFTCKSRNPRFAGPQFWSYRSEAGAPSGNSAFDAYRAETLRRLEDEQIAFAAFLKRLRDAKDKQEFDAFMTARAQPGAQADQPQDAQSGAEPAEKGAY